MNLDQLSVPEQGNKNSISWAHVLLERHSHYAIHILSESEEIDEWLLECIDKIPYFSWGWAINISKMNLISGIPQATYSTLIAICQKFLNLPESYWNDNKSKTRDFSGIMELIEKRLWELGYQVTEKETQHYLDDDNKKRIFIPTKISIIPLPEPQFP